MSMGLLGLSFFNHFNYSIDAASGCKSKMTVDRLRIHNDQRAADAAGRNAEIRPSPAGDGGRNQPGI